MSMLVNNFLFTSSCNKLCRRIFIRFIDEKQTLILTSWKIISNFLIKPPTYKGGFMLKIILLTTVILSSSIFAKQGIECKTSNGDEYTFELVGKNAVTYTKIKINGHLYELYDNSAVGLSFQAGQGIVKTTVYYSDFLEEFVTIFFEVVDVDKRRGFEGIAMEVIEQGKNNFYTAGCILQPEI